MNKIYNKIINLRKKIKQLNYDYYELHNSKISDQKFDYMMKELIFLEKKYPEFFDQNSPSQIIGGSINKKFLSIHHEFPMYSLNNAYSEKEILEFDHRIKKIIKINPTYICELKYDGISISLKYLNKKLIYGATRGDGYIGDDVTNNIQKIKNIPLIIQKNFLHEFYIHGEIIVPISSFKEINSQRKTQGLNIYSNPRNTASGTVKLQSNDNTIAGKYLKCFIYSMISKNFSICTQKDILEFGSELGFEVPNHYKYCSTISEVLNFIKLWNNKRYELDYCIDGIVIKLNYLNYQKKIGYTSKYPRWALAYKFPSKKNETILQSISYQIGRTGIITPIAELKPILLDGTIIKRALIHNTNFIKKMDLHINDHVIIEKSGEIIPKIINVIKNKRPNNIIKIQFPTFCPECNTKLKQKNKINFFCTNEIYCSSQIIKKIEHFVSRKAMNIQYIGYNTIKKLVQKKIIQNYADLYILKKSDLILLDRIEDKTIYNILTSINNSKLNSFDKVLFALGIPNLGEIMVKKIIKKIKSIDELILKTKTELMNIQDIGEITATNIVNFFNNSHNLKIIKQLKKFNLHMIAHHENTTNDISMILDGQLFAFTGKLKKFSRDKIKNIITMYGGNYSNYINEKIDYIIVGDNPGIKLAQTKQYKKIKIITENQFLDLINKNN